MIDLQQARRNAQLLRDTNNDAALVGAVTIETLIEEFEQRAWVGLTTDELKEVADRYNLRGPNLPVAFRTIEARLKEKNA